MSIEQFRTEFASRLCSVVDADTIQRVLTAFDTASVGFDVKRAETALSVVGGLPEPVKYYIASLAVENKARGTIDGYRRDLVRFFGAIRKPIDQITTNDVRVYLYNYQAEHNIKKSTVEHLRVVINAFLNWCASEEYIPKNPASKIKPIAYQRGTRHAITMLELERMRSACTTRRQKAILDFMYSTGCRVSEVAAVVMNDIDWNSKTVIVRHGKGDKQRVVYLNSESIVSLRAYINERRDGSEYVFVSKRAPHGKLTNRAIENEITAIANAAGVPGVHPHILRHTMATIALRNGMPVEQVQTILGHVSLNTTMIYAKTDTRSVAMNHERFVS